MVPALRVVRHTLQGGGHVPTAARGVETGGLLTASRLISYLNKTRIMPFIKYTYKCMLLYVSANHMADICTMMYTYIYTMKY